MSQKNQSGAKAKALMVVSGGQVNGQHVLWLKLGRFICLISCCFYWLEKHENSVQHGIDYVLLWDVLGGVLECYPAVLKDPAERGFPVFCYFSYFFVAVDYRTTKVASFQNKMKRPVERLQNTQSPLQTTTNSYQKKTLNKKSDISYSFGSGNATCGFGIETRSLVCGADSCYWAWSWMESDCEDVAEVVVLWSKCCILEVLEGIIYFMWLFKTCTSAFVQPFVTCFFVSIGLLISQRILKPEVSFIEVAASNPLSPQIHDLPHKLHPCGVGVKIPDIFKMLSSGVSGGYDKSEPVT